MDRVRATAAIVASVCLLGACTDRTPLGPTSLAADRGPLAGPSAPPAPGRYLVGFDGPAEIPSDVLASSGGAIIDSIPEFNVLVVDGVTSPEALRAANPKYIEAGFDMTVTPILSDDPLPTDADLPEAVPGAETTPWYAS